MWQSGIFRANEYVAERGSGLHRLERRRASPSGQNTSIHYKDVGNIVVIPGHADFGKGGARADPGGRRRSWSSCRACCRRRASCSRRLEAKLIPVVINTIARMPGRDQLERLFGHSIDSVALRTADFPSSYRRAWTPASPKRTRPSPLFDTLVETIPCLDRDTAPGHVATDDYGRLVIGRIVNGRIRGDCVVVPRHRRAREGTVLYGYEGSSGGARGHRGRAGWWWRASGGGDRRDHRGLGGHCAQTHRLQ